MQGVDRGWCEVENEEKKENDTKSKNKSMA